MLFLDKISKFQKKAHYPHHFGTNHADKNSENVQHDFILHKKCEIRLSISTYIVSMPGEYFQVSLWKIGLLTDHHSCCYHQISSLFIIKIIMLLNRKHKSFVSWFSVESLLSFLPSLLKLNNLRRENNLENRNESRYQFMRNLACIVLLIVRAEKPGEAALSMFLRTLPRRRFLDEIAFWRNLMKKLSARARPTTETSRRWREILFCKVQKVHQQ